MPGLDAAGVPAARQVRGHRLCRRRHARGRGGPEASGHPGEAAVQVAVSSDSDAAFWPCFRPYWHFRQDDRRIWWQFLIQQLRASSDTVGEHVTWWHAASCCAASNFSASECRRVQQKQHGFHCITGWHPSGAAGVWAHDAARLDSDAALAAGAAPGWAGRHPVCMHMP